MAVTFDAASTGEAAASGLTFSHTTSGSNRGLLVGVETFVSGGGPIPSSVTYGGVAMTQVDTILFGNFDNERLTTYRLENPASGANDVVVTVTGTDEVVAAAVSVNGCDQANMLSASVIGVDDAATTHDVTVASASGELVVDFVAWFNAAMTVDASQDQRINNDNGSSLESIAASTEAGVASVVMAWTSGAATSSGHAAMAVREAAAGGGDRYLLESSAVDGYQLEDGSGVYLIETLPEISGSLSQTLGAATLAATAAAPVSGSLAVTLGPATLAGTAIALVSASLSSTLAAATLAGTAVAPVSAFLASTLDAVTLSASGTVEEAGAVTGTLASTLGAVTLVASAVVPVSSSLASTLGAVTLAASAIAPVSASLSSTLGTAMLAATAVAPISASLAAALGAATLSASGTSQDPGVFGTFAATLGAATLVASAVAPASASLAVTLGEAILVASAAASVTGSLVVTLDAATAIAYATSPAIIPETPFPLTQEQTFMVGGRRPRPVLSRWWASGRRH